MCVCGHSDPQGVHMIRVKRNLREAPGKNMSISASLDKEEAPPQRHIKLKIRRRNFHPKRRAFRKSTQKAKKINLYAKKMPKNLAIDGRHNAMV